MIEVRCEYLSVRCIWLYVLMMLCTRIRVNPHSVVAWMSRNSSLEAGAISEVYVTAIGLEPTTSQFVKRVRDMIRAYSHMHRANKYSQHSSIIWLVWLTGWVFVYKLSGYRLESCYSCLNFNYCACLEQGVP